MTGISMGGHTTLLTMAMDTRIAVGAPMIGSGDYRRLMELRGAANGTPAKEFPRYFPAGLQAAVARFDPIHNVARFADRPLLLANGADDTLVQLECNQRLAAALPYYTDAERLTPSPCPGVGHDVPPAMWAEVKSWPRRWLVEDPIAVLVLWYCRSFRADGGSDTVQGRTDEELRDFCRRNFRIWKNAVRALSFNDAANPAIV